ncbi:hypothetical protein MCP1_1080002 [Candidatus Terasakiella magnetica]|nr:hypothetical protein MCP1_1080002 [Candidatus Terasakiella magnetica]
MTVMRVRMNCYSDDRSESSHLCIDFVRWLSHTYKKVLHPQAVPLLH